MTQSYWETGPMPRGWCFGQPIDSARRARLQLGEVRFSVNGPGVIVGGNPFQLAASGGVGAVWIKAKPGSAGRIRIEAEHTSLGKKFVEIAVRALPENG
jgi:hypothetical protein